MARVKWPKKSSFRIHIPIYDQAIYLFTDRASWDQAREYLGHEPYENHAQGLSCTYMNREDGSTIYTMAVFDGDLGTLVHESVHVAIDMCDALGIKFGADNNETFAYLVGFIFDKCRKHINEEG